MLPLDPKILITLYHYEITSMIEEYEHFNWEVFHLNCEKSNFTHSFIVDP